MREPAADTLMSDSIKSTRRQPISRSTLRNYHMRLLLPLTFLLVSLSASPELLSDISLQGWQSHMDRIQIASCTALWIGLYSTAIRIR